MTDFRVMENDLSEPVTVKIMVIITHKEDYSIIYDNIIGYDVFDGCLCLWSKKNDALKMLKAIFAPGGWCAMEVLEGESGK